MGQVVQRKEAAELAVLALPRRSPVGARTAERGRAVGLLLDANRQIRHCADIRSARARDRGGAATPKRWPTANPITAPTIAAGERAESSRDLEVEQPVALHAAPHSEQHDAPGRSAPPRARTNTAAPIAQP